MISERVHVVFRVSTHADNRALPQVETRPSGSLRLVAEASGLSGTETGRWLVEVDLGGVNLDPEYWLRRCHGFLVDSESSEGVGVVDDVELASGSNRAVGLVVASGWFGRHLQTLAVEDLQAIEPSERRLVVKSAGRTAGDGRSRA